MGATLLYWPKDKGFKDCRYCFCFSTVCQFDSADGLLWSGAIAYLDLKCSPTLPLVDRDGLKDPEVSLDSNQLLVAPSVSLHFRVFQVTM